MNPPRRPPRRWRHAVLAAALTPLLVPVAQAQVCRWVDESGQVHFADRCPPGVEAEAVVLPKGPSEDRVEAARRQSEALQDRVQRGTTEPRSEQSRQEPGLQQPPRTLSPEDVRCPRANVLRYVARMERACEEARERQIAPLRQERIERCVSEEGRSRSACAREFADFMNPRYVGRLEPRPFDYLPECVIVRTCRERSGLGDEWPVRRRIKRWPFPVDEDRP